MDKPERPMPRVRGEAEARRATEPVELVTGSFQGAPVVFLHDPERPDRLEKLREAFPWA
jgi:hypothetical protein